jgi:hypothetical protein
VLVWLSGFVSVWIFRPDTKKRRNCVAFPLFVWLSGISEESALTKTEFLQTMRQTKARTAPPPDPVATALRRAGIPTDAPYYAGAFQAVERAVKAAKKAARRPEQNEYRKDCPDTTAAARCFWQAYLLSLCGHLKQLEREAEPEDKPQERQLLRGGIRTVQAVLYALQETERTESEPRETA